jgi:hypothetical protein
MAENTRSITTTSWPFAESIQLDGRRRHKSRSNRYEATFEGRAMDFLSFSNGLTAEISAIKQIVSPSVKGFTCVWRLTSVFLLLLLVKA